MKHARRRRKTEAHTEIRVVQSDDLVPSLKEDDYLYTCLQVSLRCGIYVRVVVVQERVS